MFTFEYYTWYIICMDKKTEVILYDEKESGFIDKERQKRDNVLQLLMQEEYDLDTKNRSVTYSKTIASYLIYSVLHGKSLNAAVIQYNEKAIQLGIRTVHRVTVYRWMDTYEDFGAAMQRARVLSATAVYDDILDIEEAIRNDDLSFKAGRVLLESLRWRAERLAPEHFGRQMQIHSKSEVDIRITSQIPEPQRIEDVDIMDADVLQS